MGLGMYQTILGRVLQIECAPKCDFSIEQVDGTRAYLKFIDSSTIGRPAHIWFVVERTAQHARLTVRPLTLHALVQNRQSLDSPVESKKLPIIGKGYLFLDTKMSCLSFN